MVEQHTCDSLHRLRHGRGNWGIGNTAPRHGNDNVYTSKYVLYYEHLYGTAIACQHYRHNEHVCGADNGTGLRDARRHLEQRQHGYSDHRLNYRHCNRHSSRLIHHHLYTQHRLPEDIGSERERGPGSHYGHGYGMRGADNGTGRCDAIRRMEQFDTNGGNGIGGWRGNRHFGWHYNDYLYAGNDLLCNNGSNSERGPAADNRQHGYVRGLYNDAEQRHARGAVDEQRAGYSNRTGPRWLYRRHIGRHSDDQLYGVGLFRYGGRNGERIARGNNRPQ